MQRNESLYHSVGEGTLRAGAGYRLKRKAVIDPHQRLNDGRPAHCRPSSVLGLTAAVAEIESPLLIC